MTSVAIMQPTFLPWLGYFDLMRGVDLFVLLDSVQFDYRSWQHRNRIPTSRGVQWLTVPVRTSDHRAPIRDCRIGTSDGFPDNLLGRVHEAYQGAPFRSLLDEVLEPLARSRPGDRLSDLNEALLEQLRTVLGVTTPLRSSTKLGVEGRRSELLSRICVEVGASTYVTPMGSVDYLTSDRGLFDAAEVEIRVHHFDHPEYPQRHEPFESHASSIDSVANVGDASRRLLDEGHREWPTLAEHLQAPSP